MFIESAAPLSIFGVSLVFTAAQSGPLTLAFAYVWSMFCVESSRSHFVSTPKRTYLTVSLGSFNLTPHK